MGLLPIIRKNTTETEKQTKVCTQPQKKFSAILKTEW